MGGFYIRATAAAIIYVHLAYTISRLQLLSFARSQRLLKHAKALKHANRLEILFYEIDESEQSSDISKEAPRNCYTGCCDDP